MISVIICSKSEELLEKLTQNIKDTIGVPFEIIAINNKDGRFGICKAYNEGAAKARYDIFCFAHEDIFFETAGWGDKVVAHLSDVSVGLIGVAGGDPKSLVPSSWSPLIIESEMHLVQHYKRGSKPAEKIMRTGTPGDGSLAKPVTCIDGVWMCTKREVFQKYSFDDNTFKGFHAYDIDLSLQISSEFKVCVVFDILIHHYSEGSFDKVWMTNALMISEKWRKELPRSVRDLPKTEIVRQHWTCMANFIDKLIKLNYTFSFTLRHFFKYSFNRYFHWKHFLHFLKYILLEYFKRNKKKEKKLQNDSGVFQNADFV